LAADDVTIPNLPEVKTVDFDVIRDYVRGIYPDQLVNARFDAYRDPMNYIVVELIRKMLSRAAENEVVIDVEKVPADWLSHLIVTLTGEHVPEGYGWRWKLYRLAKWQRIETRTKHYRVCPHIAISDTSHHIQWMVAVEDDARQSWLQGRHK
jgi:hypothetical protein